MSKKKIVKKPTPQELVKKARSRATDSHRNQLEKTKAKEAKKKTKKEKNT